VRGFNRFYTRRIGVLSRGYLDSPFSLAEIRVLYELAHRERLTAGELARDLDLDAGYLSRILRGFLRRGMLDRTRSERDGREHLLSLTPHGRAIFAPPEAGARAQIGVLLGQLTDRQQQQLVEAMRTIEGLLGEPAAEANTCVLRQPRAGDMGWAVQRHGALYAQEYGWDEQFEALVAGSSRSSSPTSTRSASAAGSPNGWVSPWAASFS
jgi:DNA-binding MarR family transcriptional regulator